MRGKRAATAAEAVEKAFIEQGLTQDERAAFWQRMAMIVKLAETLGIEPPGFVKAIAWMQVEINLLHLKLKEAEDKLADTGNRIHDPGKDSGNDDCGSDQETL